MDKYTSVDITMWLGFAALMLLIIVLLFKVEGRWFAARGKRGAWWILRLGTIPIAALTALVIILPARSISGMEALAFFYIALFTVGPIFYFGLHWLLGRLVHPSMSGGQSAWVAFSGLMLVMIIVSAAHMFQTIAFSSSRAFTQMKFESAPLVSLPHNLEDAKRFILPEKSEVWTFHLRAPAGIQIDRIDLGINNQFGTDMGRGLSSMVCQAGSDFHVLWPVDAPVPTFRIYWHQNEGKLVRSEWSPTMPKGEPNPLSIIWTADGFIFPVRVPRGAVLLGYQSSSGGLSFNQLNPLQPGENFEESCLPLQYRRIAYRTEPLIAALMLQAYRINPTEPVRGIFHRPEVL